MMIAIKRIYVILLIVLEDCVQCHTQARINIGAMSGFYCTACHQFLTSAKES